MSDEPTPTQADEKAKQLRERAMDFLAGAAIHVQRLDDAAAAVGLTPDVVDGLGDQLYKAAIAQLDVASAVLERSQRLVDRLLDLATPRRDTQFKRVDVGHGKPGRLEFDVCNPSELTATVEVRLEWGGPELAHRVGQSSLPGHRATAVEITLPADLGADRVYPLLVHVSLAYEGRRRIDLPVREYEIWVSP